jgi:hypothetical protein
VIAGAIFLGLSSDLEYLQTLAHSNKEKVSSGNFLGSAAFSRTDFPNRFRTSSEFCLARADFPD